jgi:hypothetical protein
MAVLATLGACGDETSAPTTTAGDTGSASGTVEVQLSEEFCAGLAQENPPSDWADTAPAELRQGAAAIVTFAETLSSQEENPNVATELADTLGADGVADQIRALATVAGEQCDSAGENIEILTQVATAATFASGESDQAYCDALRTEFADPSEQPTIDALVDLAPTEQREALEQLASSTGTGGVGANLGALLGLGLYAEARCNIDGAFGMMFLASAFAGEATDSGSGSGGESTAGNRPDPADATPANAAVAEGTNLTFTVQEVALTDEPDTYLASIVAPEGWKDDPDDIGGFTTSGSDGPSGQFGLFDEMAFRAGCDGTCEPKDWAAELGPITERFQGFTVTEERPVEGSDGRVLTLQDSSGGITGLVQRWDDGVARYFECQVDLDEENAAALPAFLAACEASRPGWITVD